MDNIKKHWADSAVFVLFVIGPEPRRALAADHWEPNGQKIPRELLCSTCNRLILSLLERHGWPSELFPAHAAYLAKHAALYAERQSVAS